MVGGLRVLLSYGWWIICITELWLVDYLYYVAIVGGLFVLLSYGWWIMCVTELRLLDYL
jgi:hypothetical protein